MRSLAEHNQRFLLKPVNATKYSFFVVLELTILLQQHSMLRLHSCSTFLQELRKGVNTENLDPGIKTTTGSVTKKTLKTKNIVLSTRSGSYVNGSRSFY